MPCVFLSGQAANGYTVHMHRRMRALMGGSWALTAAGSPEPVVRYQSNVPRQVVVVAHQDDWQVFMVDRIGQSLSAGDSTTFIYLTAGDDGRDSAYWHTRERAALQSTRVAIGAPAPQSGT